MKSALSGSPLILLLDFRIHCFRIQGGYGFSYGKFIIHEGIDLKANLNKIAVRIKVKVRKVVLSIVLTILMYFVNAEHHA